MPEYVFSSASAALCFMVLHVPRRHDCVRHKDLRAMTSGCARDRQGCYYALDDFQALRSAALRHGARKQRVARVNDIVVHPVLPHHAAYSANSTTVLHNSLREQGPDKLETLQSSPHYCLTGSKVQPQVTARRGP